MSNLQLKTQVGTRVWTRNRFVFDTAQKFLHIPESRGRNMSFWNKSLELLIRNQFLKKLDVVAHDKNGNAKGGIKLVIDWDEHQNQIMSFGDEVDMSGFAQGGTFASIEDSLKALQRYFDGICDAVGSDFISIWFTLNPAEIEKYGLEKIYQIIEYAPTSEQRRRSDELLDGITEAEAGAKERMTYLADQREVGTGGWIAGA